VEETSAGVATRSGRAVVRGAAAVFAAVVAFGGLVGGASPAVADGASASPSATAAGAAGTLFFDYASGHDDDPIDLATSGRCPGQGDWLSASIAGPGFPAGGASVLGLSAASIYPAASTGGYVVPLDQTLRSIARQSGISSLHGSYRVDVYCRGRFQPAHLRDFIGTLTFATPGSWTADHSTPVAMPESTEPVMTAKPQPAPTAASGKGGGMSLLSVPAMVAGALLLVGLGVSALRRRRAEVLVERKANQVGKKTRDTAAAASDEPDDSEQLAEQSAEQSAEQPAAKAKAARR
jgi:hypothetical protein